MTSAIERLQLPRCVIGIPLANFGTRQSPVRCILVAPSSQISSSPAVSKFQRTLGFFLTRAGALTGSLFNLC